MAVKSSTKTTSSKLDYQSLSAELESIIAKLQDERTSIDESLKLYEQANKLVSDLSQYLASAENRLNSITASSSRKS